MTTFWVNYPFKRKNKIECSKLPLKWTNCLNISAIKIAWAKKYLIHLSEKTGMRF